MSDKWSPALQIRTVLLSIQALLSAPNPDDPLANDVAEKWKASEAEAIEIGESNDLLWFYRRFVPLSTQLWTSVLPLPSTFALKEHLAFLKIFIKCFQKSDHTVYKLHIFKSIRVTHFST